MKQTIKTLIIALAAVLVSTTAWAEVRYKCNIEVSLNSPYGDTGEITEIVVDGLSIFNNTTIELEAGKNSINVSCNYSYMGGEPDPIEDSFNESAEFDVPTTVNGVVTVHNDYFDATITCNDIIKGGSIGSCNVTVPNQMYNYGYYIGYNFEGEGHGGIKVYDGEILLTCGTDYTIGGAESYDYQYYEDPCTHENEHCFVTIFGTGEYTGKLTADFVILPTTDGGSWGDLTWSYADGTLSITGTGAMKAADNYYSYPWYAYCSSITTITIGEGITSIAAAAFGGTYLLKPYEGVTTVNLPASLKEIGENAFAFCSGATFNADNLIEQGITYAEKSFDQVGCLVGTLVDNADNTTKIDLLNQARRANVTLSGRTLYKDGGWNTIVLPFDIADINAKEDEEYICPLHGATVMELNVADKWALVSGDWEIDNVSGTSQTGLVDGTLTLYFKETTSIEAGKPYIIKWADGDNLVNPVFTNVPTDKTLHNVDFTGGSFKGTYTSNSWGAEDKSILLVGTGNSLYWPQSSASLGAFRAYFQLSGGASVRELNMNFGEGNGDATRLNDSVKMLNDKEAAAWYTLDGRKLNGQPTARGIYIHGGRKVVIK